MTLDEFNDLLLAATQDLEEASQEHLRLGVQYAELAGSYDTRYAIAYAESAGLDLSKPVHLQREKRSKGTVDEHSAYAKNKMALDCQQIVTLKHLVEIWEGRVKAITTKISAYQSMASNERGQIALTNAQAQAAMMEKRRY
jgi:hypothetical protein